MYSATNNKYKSSGGIMIVIFTTKYECTYSGFAHARALEGDGVVGIREGEVLVRRGLGVKAVLFGEGDHIGRVKAVFGVVQWKLRDTGLVGVASHISLGNLASHPHSTQLVLSLANKLHDPVK